eukprot:TRINITY_DN4077_c0_g1_i2.p1 TRINITY_DN4077_c0_g1~~TRINITY_DN4077_c0_g1_i2.p1  ORF type:complete len:147 (-),score=45.43 TRINITY_DN4077_c0_g1_i2:159-599(-)
MMLYLTVTECYFFFLMIRRPPRSTQSRSSAASDVYKRQGMYPIRGDRLSSFTAIFLGLIFFACIPAGILAYLPYYTRLREQGQSKQEIAISTIKLVWGKILRYKRKAKRKWDKSYAPWWKERFRCCRTTAEQELSLIHISEPTRPY